jgi:hypothetical protein
MGSVHRGRRIAAVALLAALAAACAGVDPTPPPSPLVGVRKVALIRRESKDDHRPKDPLDAVAESLTAKGIEVRFVAVDGHGDDARSAARLFDDVEGRVASPGQLDARGRSAGSLGDTDARIVRALGVDAVVTYHRWRGLAAADPFPAPSPYARPQARTRAIGALGIVGPAGELVAFGWGPHDTTLEPNAAETAAEAVDATVRALTGEPDGA